jgi:streptogramin lyase
MRSVLYVAAMLVAATAFAHPGSGIAVHAGTVYFVDTGGGVFALEGGRVTRIPGPAFHWFAVDPRGQYRNVQISGGDLTPAGPMLMSSDVPVVVGTDGAFYYSQGNRLLRVAPDGTQSLRATLPNIRWANDIAAGPNGSIYYTEDAAVRRVDRGGRITTVAERITVPGCVTIPGNTRPYLRGLAVAPDGSIYVAASGCGALLKIDPRGRVAPLLRTASPWAPTAVTVANGEVYILEYSHTASEEDRTLWIPRVRRIGRDGKVTNLGGSGRR